MYRITLSEQARKEYLYFVQSGNKAILNKIQTLLEDIAEHPYTGIGKPEPLKYELTGKWSRRINSEHRIVYSVHDDIIEVYIFSMRYHYSKKQATSLILKKGQLLSQLSFFYSLLQAEQIKVKLASPNQSLSYLNFKLQIHLKSD